MNEIPRTRSAHPLFPSDQAFLWLPGFAGDRRPFCTWNVLREPASSGERASVTEPRHDGNGSCFAPPYPVSEETHIMWHTNVTPPYPYHPVPVSRTLAPDEIEELSRKVVMLLGEKENRYGDPQEVLRNDCKFHILAVLSEMGLLQAPSAAPMSAGSFKSAS